MGQCSAYHLTVFPSRTDFDLSIEYLTVMVNGQVVRKCTNMGQCLAGRSQTCMNSTNGHLSSAIASASTTSVVVLVQITQSVDFCAVTGTRYLDALVTLKCTPAPTTMPSVTPTREPTRSPTLGPLLPRLSKYFFFIVFGGMVESYQFHADKQSRTDRSVRMECKTSRCPCQRVSVM